MGPRGPHAVSPQKNCSKGGDLTTYPRTRCARAARPGGDEVMKMNPHAELLTQILAALGLGATTVAPFSACGGSVVDAPIDARAVEDAVDVVTTPEGSSWGGAGGGPVVILPPPPPPHVDYDAGIECRKLVVSECARCRRRRAQAMRRPRRLIVATLVFRPRPTGKRVSKRTAKPACSTRTTAGWRSEAQSSCAAL